jgi:hypothetical protein
MKRLKEEAELRNEIKRLAEAWGFKAAYLLRLVTKTEKAVRADVRENLPRKRSREMELNEKNKAHIDAMSYEALLSHWRFAPAGDPWFRGETGKYWSERMAKLRSEGADHVGASKRIGR